MITIANSSNDFNEAFFEEEKLETPIEEENLEIFFEEEKHENPINENPIENPINPGEPEIQVSDIINIELKKIEIFQHPLGNVPILGNYYIHMNSKRYPMKSSDANEICSHMLSKKAELIARAGHDESTWMNWDSKALELFSSTILNSSADMVKQRYLYMEAEYWAWSGNDNIIYPKCEKIWGPNLYGKNVKMWSSYICEFLVRMKLQYNGEIIQKPEIKNKYKPDLETENAIYEIKGRMWSVSDTAGEKILGVPYKYGDIPTLYKKPLIIVCVAYQEYEANIDFKLFNPPPGTRKDMIEFWKQHQITFVKFTDL